MPRSARDALSCPAVITRETFDAFQMAIVMHKTSPFMVQVKNTPILRLRDANDDLAKMRTCSHVPVSRLNLGKIEYFIDRGLDRVCCDGAVHHFEHFGRADRNPLNVSAARKDESRIELARATA